MTQTLPGLIDVHVHLREPGATHKEDFATGSAAAVAGGFTYILDMPNNPTPTVSIERLEEKIALADQKAVCDIGFHFGTNGQNTDTFAVAAVNPRVFGLKLYCNHTTGEMLLEDIVLLEQVFRSWESEKPILVHAEGTELAAAIGLAHIFGRRLHVCHITQKVEVELVRRAKQQGQAITAGVCPHHLWMTGEARERLGSFAIMKPPLGTEQDMAALWEGIADGTIDIVETDHAPHTRQEKAGDPAPYGVPGLETALSLTYLGLIEHGLSTDMLVQLLHDRPKKIFALPDQPDTHIEVDFDATWVVGEAGYASKCGWSPFEGKELPGVVQRVVWHGMDVLVPRAGGASNSRDSVR
jgi:dihydroorotase-like cyclic amidohydrolase